LQKIIINITKKHQHINQYINFVGTYRDPYRVPIFNPHFLHGHGSDTSPRHRFLGGFGGHANGPRHRRLRDLGDLGWLLGGREPLLEISFMDNIINIVET
jgi:hypothetical protein